jgi:hypothetical protein
MSAHRVLVLIAALCALLSVPQPSTGQIAIFPAQDLVFGPLQRGVPEFVATTDAARRAQFDVIARGSLIATFVLPTEMVSLANGSVLPIAILANDGLAGRSNSLVVFDPTQPLTFRGHPSKPFSLYLGGTADPGASQSPGSYSATITLFVIQAGA